MVAAFGVQSALLLDAASFYVIGWILLTAKPLPQPEPDGEAGMAERVRAGLGYIRRNPTLRRLLAAEAGALIFFSVVVPVEVIYAKETLGVGATDTASCSPAGASGWSLAASSSQALRRASLPVLLFFSTVAIGAGYLGMAAAPALAVACAASAIGGLGNGIQWVAVISAVQELTAPTMQARVLGTLESSASATPGLGYRARWPYHHAVEPASGVLRRGGRRDGHRPRLGRRAGQELAAGQRKRTSREL